MRVRLSYDAFRLQAHGGVSRYASELHRGLVGLGVDSRVLAPLHRNAYLRDQEGVLGVDVADIRPERLRQALTKVVDRSFERVWAPGQDRRTVYHKTYFDRHVPTGPTLAVTVYDMIHERYPDHRSARDATLVAKQPWCEQADVVFAISAHTRRELLDRYALDPDRVLVTPLGVTRVEPDPSVRAADGRPFVLYVGERGPAYKNFEGFATAFAHSGVHPDLALVCFGGGPLRTHESALLERLGLGDTRAASGSDRVLAAHYAQARALVYPSHYEGFGLPPLEAMSHDCPVAASDTSAIPEVVGHGAVLFDPGDPDDMARAIAAVVGDEALRTRLVASGHERVAAHTWEQTTQLTLKGYEQACEVQVRHSGMSAPGGTPPVPSRRMAGEPMTTEDAVRHMRSTAEYHSLVEEAYLDEDAGVAAARFAGSVEFQETLRLLGMPIEGCRVLDLGAGTGVASRALAGAGAELVVAVEPDLSDVVGLGQLRSAPPELSIAPLSSFAESLPLVDDSIDVVYCRQVLHHLHHLPEALAAAARVLRPGGVFIATREHVVDDPAQLAQFLDEHPVHRLAGGEHAWSLAAYRSAITGAGLEMTAELGPWDAVINAFPAVTSEAELARGPEVVLRRRVGPHLGRLAGLPGIEALLWRRLRRAKPGRLYTFVAVKPMDGWSPG